MMGTLVVRIKGKSYEVPLSGAYGADGLIRGVPRPVYELGVELPPELREAWNLGGGHNSAGSEAADMDEWAKTLVYPASTYKQGKR